MKFRKYKNILIETEANGSQYKYEYDVINRLTGIYFRDNSKKEFVRIEQIKYETLNNGNIQKTDREFIDETGKKYSQVITTYDYADRVIKVLNDEGLAVITEYNPSGTIKSSTNISGNTTYYKYDGLGRVTEQWVPVSRENETIYYSYNKIEYDNASNKISECYSSEKVLLNQVPSSLIYKYYTYYKDNRKKSEKTSYGAEKLYEYDKDGNVTKVKTKVDNDSYSVIQYVYDKYGRVINEIKSVLAGDLAGYDYNSTETVELVTKYEYDKEGNIVKETNSNNVSYSYTYDNLGNILSCTTTDGKSSYTISKTYNWEGKVLTETDKNNNKKTYNYNARGFLIKEIDGEGNITQYYYDLAGRKIAEVMPKDYDSSKSLSETNRIEYVYDKAGRITQKKNVYYDKLLKEWKTIVSVKYEYDNSGNVIRETYADGSYITYSYDLANRIETYCDAANTEKGIAYNTKYEYDANNNKIYETNSEGTVIRYIYNDAGNVVKTTILGKGETTETVISTNEYNLVGENIKSVNANNVTTKYEYNEFGKIRKITYAGDDSVEEYFIIFQYDSIGNLVKSVTSKGVVTKYSYDMDGNELSKEESKEDGSDSIIIKHSYDANGNILTETDANGNVTKYQYNKNNKVISVTNANNQKTTYSYDKNGNIISKTNWLGNTITYEYDELDRKVKEIDPYGNVVITLEYNDVGTQKTSTDALGNKTEFEYDNNRRLISVKDPEGSIKKTIYNTLGNVEAEVDGNGNITKYNYDKFGNLIEVVKNNNGISESTKYTYDNNGNMLSQEDSTGNVTRFEYNVLNKVSKKIYPQSGTGEETYVYYGDANLKEYTDRNGNTTTYTYDVHGRLIKQITTNKLSDNTIVIENTYDNNGNILSIKDSSGLTEYTYDKLNGIISKKVSSIGEIKYEYDIVTLIDGLQEGYYASKVIYPDGNIVIKIYDKNDRLVEVRDGNNITKYTYNINSSLKEIVLPNGYVESYEYYKDTTNKSVINKKNTGEIIATYTYFYDNAKNIIKKIDDKGTTTYTYDTLNRVKVVTEPTKTITYSYDASGNRDKEEILENGILTIKKYTYDANNRLLKLAITVSGSEEKTTEYTYDKNGNELSETTIDSTTGKTISNVTYEYDLLNQQVKVITADNKEIHYSYNGEGLRVYKSVNGNVTRYLYEGLNAIYETDKDGNKTASSIKGINLISRSVNGKELYYLYNGHKDVVALADKEGKIIATYYYDTFGVLTDSTGEADNPIRYSGYQYDEETGLYYLNARMYDSSVARFLQEDTYTGDIKDPLSLNLYTYCQNNPLIYDDPTGHFLHILIGAAVGAAVNVGIKMATDLITTGKLGSAKSYVGAAVSGAITGAVAAATGGASLGARLALNGAAGFIGSCAEQKISTGKVNYKQAAFEGIFNAGGSIKMKDIKKAGSFIGAGAEKISGKINSTNLGKKALDKISSVTSKIKTSKIGNIASKTKNFASSTVNRLKDKGKQVFEKASKAVTNNVNKAKSSLKKGFQGVSEVINNKKASLKEAANNFSKNMTRGFERKPAFAGIVDDSILDDASDFASKEVHELTEVQKNFRESMKNASSDNISGASLSGTDSGSNYVYRTIRPDEVIENGLTAKNPNAKYTLTGHVNNNSKPGYASQYISTTKDFDNVAKIYADKTGNRVVRIDLDKLPDNVKIYDLSTEANRQNLLNGWRARGYAKASVEVDIEGFIPADAIELYYKPN